MVSRGSAGLEVFKAIVIVGLPIVATIVYSDPEVMRQIIDSTQYVIYPPEAPRPPQDYDEMDKMMKEMEQAAKVRREKEKIGNSKKEGMASAEVNKGRSWWKVW
jgi:hypothetical protein